jgi:preprotein translocase subunit SecA
MSLLNAPAAIYKTTKGVVKKIIGTRNDRLLKRIWPIANTVDELETQIRQMPDEELQSRAQDLRAEIVPQVEEFEAWFRRLPPDQRRLREKEFRKQLRRFDARLAEQYFTEAAALVREASRRTQQHRHYKCQLIGGSVLYNGDIAEMKTGEGKTIVCHISAFLKILQGKRVHIITANDYLVQRDAEFARPIFEMLGFSVGYIQSRLDPGGAEGIRQAAYACDITYGTNSEFGFDYLRDNMKRRHRDQVQGPKHYAIIDEVDSLLIDEARTPLIISGSAEDDVTRYPRACKVAQDMVRRQNQLDRQLASLVAGFDGDTRGIQKLDDAMRILGYSGGKGESAKAPAKGPADEETATGALGPDFLTDDHAEALQVYQHTAYGTPKAELYTRLFIVQRDRKQVQITHDGVSFAQDALDLGSLYSGPNVEWPHLIENALRAEKVYERDKEYVVQKGEVVIVDQFTGRLMPGRQWSDGLHQAVEAKEGVRVKEETQTLATITVQNYAHLYEKISGMTGTAVTEATEFMKIYGLDVVEMPTNRPINRLDYNDKIFRDEEEKYAAIVEEIHHIRRRGRPADPFVMADALAALRPIKVRLGESTDKIDEALRQFKNAQYGDRHVVEFMLNTYDEEMGDLATGRPVLVGTTSVENSEKLSRLLERTYGIEHEVLNAKNHAREAEIVAKAGWRTMPTRGDKTPLGNVTIATNMAGRGTDIKLEEGVVYPACKVPPGGGLQSNNGDLPLTVLANQLYPPGATKCCIHCAEYDPATNCAHCYKPKIDPRFPDMGRNVCPLNVPCGLHIIGTERHEARRIDNQLRGRSGRQGDPGSSRFFLSLEDDLLKLFMPDWMLKMMGKHAFEGGAPLEMKQLTKGIEKAQRKVEERNFSTRKNLLEWDEPMDYQRKNFYDARQEILEGRRLREKIIGMIDQAIDEAVERYLSDAYSAQCLVDWCREDHQIPVEVSDFEGVSVEQAQAAIRTAAKDDARESIRRTIGEYIDPEEPASAWDIGGLQSWAERSYKVAVTQNQLRKMEAEEITELLIEAADHYYDRLNLDPVTKFLNSDFPYSTLLDWARSRFDVELGVDELRDRAAHDVAEHVREKVAEKYRRREVVYPVEYSIARSAAAAGMNPAVMAGEIVKWVNLKYAVDWKPERLDGKTLDQTREELIEINDAFLNHGRAETEIDQALAGKSAEEIEQWAAKRFGMAWDSRSFNDAENEEQRRQALVDAMYDICTWELRALEHRVLLQIYDQIWKDHLLEMDRLETAIKQRPLGGDQTHPQSQFAIEGHELFSEMWVRLRERIVELIMKIQPGAPGGGEGGAFGPAGSGGGIGGLKMSHADATGAGFTGVSADHEAAMRAQGGQQKVETIRREEPKVGRNDPCPCGSGKKFKQCHGKR